MHLLLPGRHHLLTADLLARLTLLLAERRITSILWAITSANHQNTRRNPLPGHRREAAIASFAEELDAPSFVYHIDDIGDSPRYADYILKKIEVDSHGRFRPLPGDTLVATGTPELATQFDALGYRVVPAEPVGGVPPWEVQERLVQAGLAGHDLETHPEFLTRVSRASRRLWARYGYLSQLVELHRHPVGTDDGDLTATRDYNVYTRAFDDGADRKAALIRGHVRPGRIVDVGCCTGSLIQQLCREPELRESDFYGIEMARPLYEECLHRKRQGTFASDHVFFHQANAAESVVFTPGSVDTFTTFSLTHELESYQGRAFLERFIGLMHSQLCIGGRWLNADVVGPENGDETVHLWLREDDGTLGDDRPLPEDRAGMKAHLAGLSTLGRFLRFARDFRHAEGCRLPCTLERSSAGAHAVLSLRDACEFLSKKDYLDNWRSEMHETFCYWSFADWHAAVERAGFRVMPASHAFTNPWIVANRYEGKVRLLRDGGPMPWPVTNMLLVAEKR